MKAYAYILRCRDGSFYSGWTNDPEKRLKAHNDGKASKYTRARLPADMVYIECFETKGEAMKRECALKKLTRAEKLRLIEEQSEEQKKALP